MKTITLTRDEFAKLKDELRPAYLSETMPANKSNVILYRVSLSPTLTRIYVKKGK